MTYLAQPRRPLRKRFESLTIEIFLFQDATISLLTLFPSHVFNNSTRTFPEPWGCHNSRSAADGRSLVHASQAPTTKTKPSNISTNQSFSDSQLEYVRRPHPSQPNVNVKPVVEHSEPRVVAGHVRRRGDRTVAALPPSSSRTKIVTVGQNQGGGDCQEEDQKGAGDGEDRGDGDRRDDGNGQENQQVMQPDGDDNDDEYESAPEDPWPEEIWNDAIEQRTQEEIKLSLEEQRAQGRRALENERRTEEEIQMRVQEQEKQALLALLEARRFEDLRRRENLLGTGWSWTDYAGPHEPSMGPVRQYKLMARGAMVYRLRSIRGVRTVIENISDEMLVEVGWLWNPKKESWILQMPTPDSKLAGSQKIRPITEIIEREEFALPERPGIPFSCGDADPSRWKEISWEEAWWLER